MTVTEGKNTCNLFNLPPIPEYGSGSSITQLNVPRNLRIEDLKKKNHSKLSKKTRTIELVPEYTAVKVVDGVFHSYFSTKGRNLKEKISLTDRIHRLKKNDIPLSERQLKRFFRAFSKHTDTLLNNNKVNYPAGFRVNIGITNLFLEVHTLRVQFLVILDKGNGAAVINKGGAYKDLFYAWPLHQEMVAYAVTDMRNSPRTVQQVTQREELFLNQLNGNAHVVKLYRTVYFSPNGRQVLIMKYYPNDLLEWCDNRVNGKETREYTSLEKVKIAIGLAETISYLHKNDIYHRDVKPENVLMDDMDVALTDFGLACKGEDTLTIKGMPGSLPYVSNRTLQALLDNNYSASFSPKENDLWGLGSLLWLLFAEKPMPWCWYLWDEKLPGNQKIVLALQAIQRLKKLPPDSLLSAYGIVWSIFTQDPNHPIDIKTVINSLKKLKVMIKSKSRTISVNDFPMLDDLENTFVNSEEKSKATPVEHALTRIQKKKRMDCAIL